MVEAPTVIVLFNLFWHVRKPTSLGLTVLGLLFYPYVSFCPCWLKVPIPNLNRCQLDSSIQLTYQTYTKYWIFLNSNFFLQKSSKFEICLMTNSWNHLSFVNVDFLVEVIFLLGFYYLYLLFIFVSYLGSMMPPCRYTQSSIKELILKVVKYP